MNRLIKTTLPMLLILITINPIALAASDSNSPPSANNDQGGADTATQQSGHDAALEKASAICATAAPRDQTGHPDQKAVEDCITKKGFKKRAEQNK